MRNNDWTLIGKNGKAHCKVCKHPAGGHATRFFWLLKTHRNVGRVRLQECKECDCTPHDWLEIWEDQAQQQRATAKWKAAEEEYADYGEIDLDHAHGFPDLEIPEELLGLSGQYQQVQETISEQEYTISPVGTIKLAKNDRVITKQLWKFAVPTAHEVKLLLGCFEDYTQVKVALCLTAVAGLRPIELTRLRWRQFTIENGQITHFYHKVNKPVGRTTRMGKNYEEKELRKPLASFSPWLSEQLIAYAKIAPKLSNDYLFMWNSRECLAKHLSLLRARIRKNPKKYGPEYECFFDKNSYVSIGPDQPIPYRINWYSLRRFCMTFHFYVTFKMDPIATAKFFGHSEAATTLGHYIMPKEAIGLTQKMIDDHITIDQFIHMQGKKQTRLLDYDVLWPQRFHDAAQSKIHDHQAERI